MMGTTMVDRSGWGEKRERERTRRRYRIGAVIVATSLVCALSVPFVTGFVDGVLGTHAHRSAAWTNAAMAIASTLAVAIGSLYAWRNLDEVQRRTVITAWAAAGFTAFLLNPVVRVMAPLCGWRDPAHVIWMASIAALATAWLWQWRRR